MNEVRDIHKFSEKERGEWLPDGGGKALSEGVLVPSGGRVHNPNARRNLRGGKEKARGYALCRRRPKPPRRAFRAEKLVEAVGIEPTSCDSSVMASTRGSLSIWLSPRAPRQTGSLLSQPGCVSPAPLQTGGRRHSLLSVAA